MLESVILFLESAGFTKVPEQISFLLDPVNIPFAIWETI